jgi:hypothetical protein
VIGNGYASGDRTLEGGNIKIHDWKLLLAAWRPKNESPRRHAANPSLERGFFGGR